MLLLFFFFFEIVITNIQSAEKGLEENSYQHAHTQIGMMTGSRESLNLLKFKKLLNPNPNTTKPTNQKTATLRWLTSYIGLTLLTVSKGLIRFELQCFLGLTSAGPPSLRKSLSVYNLSIVADVFHHIEAFNGPTVKRLMLLFLKPRCKIMPALCENDVYSNLCCSFPSNHVLI